MSDTVCITKDTACPYCKACNEIFYTFNSNETDLHKSLEICHECKKNFMVSGTITIQPTTHKIEQED